MSPNVTEAKGYNLSKTSKQEICEFMTKLPFIWEKIIIVSIPACMTQDDNCWL